MALSKNKNYRFGVTLRLRFRFEFEKLLLFAHGRMRTTIEDDAVRVHITTTKTKLNGLKLKELRKGRIDAIEDLTDEKQYDASWELGMRQALSYLEQLELIQSLLSTGGGKWEFDLMICPHGGNTEQWVRDNLKIFEDRWEPKREKRNASCREKAYQNKTAPNIVAISQKSDIQKLNDFFLELNYQDQLSEFNNEINNLGRNKILLGEIDGNDILQRWMLEKLVANNNMFMVRAAEKKYVKASRQWKNSEDNFWQAFLKCTASDSSEALIKMCQNNKNRPLIFVIYGVEILRLQDLNMILKCFWSKLLRTMGKYSEAKNIKCVLFFVGEAGWIAENNCKVSLSTTSIKPLIRWDEIDPLHFRDWFFHCCSNEEDQTRGESVQSFYHRKTGVLVENPYDLITIDNVMDNTASNIIDTITSNILASDKGIAQLEKYWKLG